MLKIKGFISAGIQMGTEEQQENLIERLEEKVNTFLTKSKNIKLVDIKFQYEINSMMVLVIYKEV